MMKFLLKIEEGSGFISKDLHYMFFSYYKIFTHNLERFLKNCILKKFDL